MNTPAKSAFLPDPFDWIFIPAGTVTLRHPPYLPTQSTVQRQSNAFFISKYPVTNAQYVLYLDNMNLEAETRYWQDSRFLHPLQPIIGIRWHNALLYCEWLSSKLGYQVTLPTDVQWQRAAQGDDDRLYPWGNVWNRSLCNCEDSRIGHTTRVNQYADGASPYGVMDMVGNVEEWCLTNGTDGSNSDVFQLPTELKLDEDMRVFRGGSFNSSRYSTNTIAVGSVSMHWHSYNCGIRLVSNIAR